jgi:hypothetical protein
LLFLLLAKSRFLLPLENFCPPLEKVYGRPCTNEKSYCLFFYLKIIKNRKKFAVEYLKEMEKNFAKGEDGLEWMRTQLPEEILVFFVNLNWTLYHEQPTRDNPTKLDQIRQKCEETFNQHLVVKTNEIGLLKNTTEQQQSTIATLNEETRKLRDILGTYEKDTQKKINEAVQREKALGMKELETAIRAKENEINAKNMVINNTQQELRVEKAKNITLEQQNQHIRTGIGRIEDKLENFIGTNAAAALIGQRGEDWVLQLLSNDPSIQVVSVAGLSHQGDLVVHFKNSNVKVMLEVKTYKKGTTIALDQRKKFFSDLEINTMYNAGILVSINGGFNLDIDELKVYKTDKERKPYIFLGNLISRKNPEVILKTVAFILKQYAEDEKSLSFNQKKISELIQADIAAWAATVKQMAVARQSAEKTLAVCKDLEDKAIANFRFLETGWERLRNEIASESDDSEPKRKKVVKSEHDEEEITVIN